MTIKPIRVQFKTACELLDISRESLRHIQRTDETFPKAIKIGTTKQAPVYFDYAELVEWHNNQNKALQLWRHNHEPSNRHPRLSQTRQDPKKPKP